MNNVPTMFQEATLPPVMEVKVAVELDVPSVRMTTSPRLTVV